MESTVNMEAVKLIEIDHRIQQRNEYRAMLIKLVRANPILWDKKSPNFNVRVLKIRKWLEVAEILGVSTDKIRRTWENLRDQYRRDLKRTMVTGARSKWRFFDDMSFIRSMVRIKGSCRHKSESESEYEDMASDNLSAILSANMNTQSPKPTTSTSPKIGFQPITLSTEWRQQLLGEPITKNIVQQPIQTVQQEQIKSPPQQNCDSSEEQKFDEDFYDDTIGDSSCTVKIELDSDSNDLPLFNVLHQQQQVQPEPQREPRPTAPRPANTSNNESEQYVSTSDSTTKRRKCHATITNASVEVDFERGSHSQRQHDSQDADNVQDEDYHFVMSILPSLRQVTRNRKFPLRSQIMGLISRELEEAND